MNAVNAAQPDLTPLPDISRFGLDGIDTVQTYVTTLTNIGGTFVEVTGMDDISAYVLQKAGTDTRTVTTLPELDKVAELLIPGADPHTLSDIEYAIIEARFGVAENAAVWITEQEAGYRALPFICQHLIVILKAETIVPTMHNAYDIIADSVYGHGVFIAGPSKTADIEQSLVLGAHGPRSMTILIVK